MWHTIVALDPGANGVTVAKDLIPLPDQADELRARLVAMDSLAQLYPQTFTMLLLAAREALRPMTPKRGWTPTPGPSPHATSAE